MFHITNESIIEKTYFGKSPLPPGKEGKFLPFAKPAGRQGREGGIRGLMSGQLRTDL